MSEAQAAYTRATDVDQSNPQAWQGLAELHTVTGAWAGAAADYKLLAGLAAASPPGSALHSKEASFLRRQAEFLLQAQQLQEAEGVWQVLLARTEDGTQERVECLCHLADVQLAADQAELESRVASRLAACTGDPDVCEANIRLAVEGEWSEEALEMETEHASHTLRQIIAATPPSPRYSTYHDAYLRRLRRSIQAAPPASMERHNRRVAVLSRCSSMMRGGGCCSSYAYEAALSMIEVESEVLAPLPYALVPAEEVRSGDEFAASSHSLDRPPSSPLSMKRLPATTADDYALTHTSSHQERSIRTVKLRAPEPSLSSAVISKQELAPAPAQLPLLLADSERIAVRMSHAFPWNALARVHVALSLRRRQVFRSIAPLQCASEPSLAASATAARVTAMAAVGRTAIGGVSSVSSAPQQLRQHSRTLRRNFMLRVFFRTCNTVAASPVPTTQELLCGLQLGAPCVAGWLAVADLLLEERRPEAALEAAKQASVWRPLGFGGLKYVAHRDVLGKERMVGAGLLLRLLAGRALACTGANEAAQALLEGLAGGVSEGSIRFGEMAGLPSVSIHQQATRYLAQALLARGDRGGAKQIYSELVGRELMGRSAVRAQSWAHLELGVMAAQEGDLKLAQKELSTAVQYLTEATFAATSLASPSCQQGDGYTPAGRVAALAAAHLQLGKVLYALGGACREQRRRGAHASFLCAAAAEGEEGQGSGFAWLGHWYCRVARDLPRAEKCYRRALALDPLGQEGAGVSLISLLAASSQGEAAVALCTELLRNAAAAAAAESRALAAGCATASVGKQLLDRIAMGLQPPRLATASSSVVWVLRALGSLQLQGFGGGAAAAVETHQRALRLSPGSAEVWEGMGCAYQELGRNSAAIKVRGPGSAPACGRCAMERVRRERSERRTSVLCSWTPPAPTASFSAAPCCTRRGEAAQAMDSYSQAAALDPDDPSALLGLSEVLLAAASGHARMGALGAASMALAKAVSAAGQCADQHGELQAAWKQLGDSQLHAAALTPPASFPQLSEARGGEEWASAAAAAAAGQVQMAKAARRSYLRALVCDPRSAMAWGDLAASYSQEARVLAAVPATVLSAAGDAAGQGGSLLSKSRHLLKHAIALEPAQPWLWSSLGTAAAAGPSPDPALAELAWSRALQLNPRQADVWAQLGRAYAGAGEGALAEQCFSSARGHDPTCVAAWEGMGYAAGCSSRAWGDDAHVDMMDAYQQALSLGGGLEAWMWVGTGLSLGPSAPQPPTPAAASTALSCAHKAVAVSPLLAAAHNTLGLAQQAAGDGAAAVRAFATAAALAGESFAAVARPAAGPAHAPAAQQLGMCQQSAQARQSPQAAVQLNLASALALAGRHEECVAEYGALLQEEGGGASAALSQAHALRQVRVVWRLCDGGCGSPARCRSHEACGAVDTTGGTHVGDTQGCRDAAESALSHAASHPRCGLLAVATHKLLVILEMEEGRFDEAFGLVLRGTVDQEGGGTGPTPAQQLSPSARRFQEPGSVIADARAAVVQAKMQLWLTLLAGLIVHGAAHLLPDMKRAAVQWAQSQPTLDMQEVRGELLSLHALRLASSGQALPASRHFAAALHMRPWDAHRRTLMSAACSAHPTPNPTPPSTPTALTTGCTTGCTAWTTGCTPRHTAAGRAAPRLPLHASPPAPSPPPSSLHPTPTYGDATPVAGHVTRSAALTATLAAPALGAACARELVALRHAVHAHPTALLPATTAALLSLQLAGCGEGRPCAAYRTTLHGYLRLALALAHRELGLLPGSAASVLSMFPLMQLRAALSGLAGSGPPTPGAEAGARPSPNASASAAAAAAARVVRKEAQAVASASSVAVWRGLVSGLLVRLLAAQSECQLHGRMEGGVGRAKDSALDALRWGEMGYAGRPPARRRPLARPPPAGPGPHLGAGLAQRQQQLPAGRSGRRRGPAAHPGVGTRRRRKRGAPGAIAKALDMLAAVLPPTLTSPSAQGDASQEGEQGCSPTGTGPAAAAAAAAPPQQPEQQQQQQQHLVMVAALQWALLQLRRGGRDGVRGEGGEVPSVVDGTAWEASTTAAGGVVRDGATAAAAGAGALVPALLLAALSSLHRCRAGEGEVARKAALDTRWAAAAAGRLQPQPHPVAQLLLACAEAARGRGEPSQAALRQALAAWKPAGTAPAHLQQAALDDDTNNEASETREAVRSLRCRRVHVQPWVRQGWAELAHVQ
ncbi:MAG: hypothetical protein WDW36_001941 [Sanguina aurantia]